MVTQAEELRKIQQNGLCYSGVNYIHLGCDCMYLKMLLYIHQPIVKIRFNCYNKCRTSL